ncbi:phosphate ABC transporter membrane protein 2 (PhoT family) [Salana multivorans]|uniref:Phosphate transport system permease protein PstA n=1 Tax=Salana multivorans TaxID=120377 RepID=A0A3N2DCU5_9MICO|nr:phosphate ABC transporter permease PstA [Salana multivorans]MBN8881449.1 phosphate ABC transporter permease PstA [Salana multivorans]OJX97682.1 MAG: phosphate ABC transporter, permease protein PstA [Micrococcales bacterium 73-15]ROR97254.1 phosphate ABC transporter membrane protein 2 (PhoT family) [Salana multivorans]
MTTVLERSPGSEAPPPSSSPLTTDARGRRRKATDVTMRVLVTAAFLVALIPLISLLYEVISRGVRMLSWEFLSTDMQGVFGDMTSGGILHALLGTVQITALATLISAPIGLLAAIYLVEYGKGRLARVLTFFVDVMTGIPSIVAGLFAVALFALLVGPDYRSGLMGAIALSVLMIPVVVRSCEEMLKLVPNELREAAYALGVPKWLTIVKVVLRTSLAGIVTSIVLAIARVIGETAPLLLTVGIVTQVNTNMLDGRVATLPVFAYSQYSQDALGVGADRAWGAAFVLIVLIMLLNLVARFISRRFSIAER